MVKKIERYVIQKRQVRKEHGKINSYITLDNDFIQDYYVKDRLINQIICSFTTDDDELNKQLAEYVLNFLNNYRSD